MRGSGPRGAAADAGRAARKALSEGFYADGGKTDALLDLVAAGAENLLPLQLDRAPIPDALKNALYARNIIPSAGRDAAHTAERILAALPKKKSRLPLILGGAGVVLLVLVGLLLWRSISPEDSAALAAEEPPTEIGVPIPAGLTEADLAQVRCVVIVGEHFRFYTEEERLFRPDGNWPDMLYELASEETLSQTRNWYWKEDGSLVNAASCDLRFLSLLPNLEELHICMAQITDTPDLGALQRLNVVWLYDSQVEDLEWLANSGVRKVQIECGDLDFSPLGNCRRLNCASLGLHSSKSADFSRFSPPNLTELDILCGYSPDGFDGMDLSGLAACDKLETLRLSGAPISDLSFLEGKENLAELYLSDLYALRDISALSGLKRLSQLRIDACPALGDYRPIGDCKRLHDLVIHPGGDALLRDASFLAGLSSLTFIELYGVELPDLDFLMEIGQHQEALDSFAFSGDIADFSGLSAIKTYKRLEIDLSGGSLAGVAPALANCTVGELKLGRASDVDLGSLPRVTGSLVLRECDIRDLSALPEDWNALRITLEACPALWSLEGIQKQSRIGNGFGDLVISNCPRLMDWSALAGMNLGSLKLAGVFTLPDFSTLHAGVLRLERIADLTDLSIFDAMDESLPCSFELVGLEELDNLRPLGRFHGAYLTVPPQLAEQAEDLVKAGNFHESHIEYPEGGWELDDMEFTLLSLEELDTLPPAMLRHVTTLCIAGDQLVDLERCELWEDWEHRDKNGNPTLQLYDRETDSLSSLSPGVIRDIGILGELTGLRELYLWAQPLESLDGIQALSSLETFSARGCASLTDASPLFALPVLRRADLKCTSVDSIRILRLSAPFCASAISPSPAPTPPYGSPRWRTVRSGISALREVCAATRIWRLWPRVTRSCGACGSVGRRSSATCAA